MVRTQIQLTEDQAATLKKISSERNISMAEIIRQAIDRMVQTSLVQSSGERKKKAIAAAGKFRTGIKDLAKNHDAHLLETYRQ